MSELLRSFNKVKDFNIERLPDEKLVASADIDQGKSEVKLGLMYDHHAFALYQTDIRNIKLPHCARGATVGKTF